MLIGIDGLHGPFPRTNLLVEHTANIRNRMKVEMLADVLVAQTGTQQKSRRVNGTAGADDCLAANVHAMAAFRTRLDSGCGTTLDSNAYRPRLDNEARAMLLRIREPRFRCRLLRPERA